MFNAEISHFLEYVKLFDKYASTSDMRALFVAYEAPFDPKAETSRLSNIINKHAQLLKNSSFVFCRAFFNTRTHKVMEQLMIQFAHAHRRPAESVSMLWNNVHASVT